ncbi:MAG: hypothetical protein OEW16_04440 [Gammaproteobacteria bacterium]|nr:hypothetical protein [Gammaproteobacteria bacterium]
MSFLKNSGLKALGFAAVAAVALGACSGGSANDDLALIRATLSIKTVSQGGVCESVRIRLTPKEFIGEANKYANNKMMVAEVNMIGPTDEDGAPMCNGSGETLPMAPGNWEFSAPLASGTVTCVRNIQADGDLSILLIDGVDGCGGPSGVNEMSAESEMPAEGETPPESADAAAPAAD